MSRFSKRGDIAAFLAMDVMRAARAKSRRGADICHMEVGQPGSKAPGPVRARAKRGLDEELIGYTEALGTIELREAISAHYQTAYGCSVESENVIITTGSSAGFVLAFLATLDAGDKVAITMPGYPCYREILKALDLQPVFLPLGFENDWRPGLDDVSEVITREGVRAILLASPANPTGAVLNDQFIRGIADLAQRSGVWLMMDEIYHGLIYDQVVQTAAGLNERVIVLNSFSKYYCMTGWRVGWMVVPSDLLRVVEKLNQHLFISAPALSQYAAVAAFDSLPELEAIKAGYQRNRAVLLKGLADCGFERIAPADGAFYIYTDVSEFSDDSMGFARHLLDAYGIAVCPGVDFDAEAGRRFLRFSYAGSEREVREAVRRLKARPLELL